MYKVSIGGVVREIECKGVSVEGGNILFFCDDACTKSKFVVAAGKWESLEVLGDSDALQIRQAKSISTVTEAGGSEEVRETQLPEGTITEENKEEG